MSSAHIPRRRTALLAAAVCLAALLPLGLAGPAQAAFVTVIDPDGIDDIMPAQLDLTSYGIDDTGGATFGLQISFDDTTGTGNNTRDACLLLDTDGDGNANSAVCVTVTPGPGAGPQPLQLTSPTATAYTCDDSSATKCGSSTPVATTSSCTAAQTATDPFTVGASDTVVTCTIVRADVGGGAAIPSAVCAHPAGQINSQAFDCFAVGRAASLVIVKQAPSPSGDAVLFPFVLSSTVDPAATVFTATGTQTSGSIPLVGGRTYTLAETVPGGWQTPTASCVDASGAPVGTPGGTGVSAITPAVGAVITCTFVNSDIPPAGVVSVVKSPSTPTVPEPGAPVTFTVTVSNATAADITVTALTDSVFGDLVTPVAPITASTCNALTSVLANSNASCTFTVPILGVPGFVHSDTVTATVSSALAGPAPVTSNIATVTVTDLLPTLTVDKAAVPTTLTTAGPVVFTVTVTNTSSVADALTLGSLMDTVYGDLTALAGSTCAVPQTIAPAGVYSCTFTQTVTGSPGAPHVNTVTATAADEEQNAASGSDGATVTFLTPTTTTGSPSADVRVDKAVEPFEVGVGQTAVFTLLVTNTGPDGASGVTVTDTVPATLDITDVTTSQGTCTTAGQQVDCTIGSLAGGASATVSISVEATAEGSFENLTVIDSTSVDPDPSDDSDTATLEVVGLDVAGTCERLEGGVERVEGSGRIQTAIAGSQLVFCDSEATAVVLTRSDLFPDAQAGTPLALDEDAPLLLTEPDVLNTLTEGEILRVLQPGGTVYLLGGTVALSQAVEDRIVELGFQAVRYGGDNRFGTAAIIADQGLDNPLVAMVADGGDFPDSVIAGAASLAAGGGIGLASVLLTDGERIPAETANYLAGVVNPPTLYAVGAPARAAFPDVPGFGSDDRYETSVAVAERFFTMPRIVGIATGAEFADALTGGAVIGRGDIGPGPMLLVDGEALTPATITYLSSNADTLVAAVIFGGEAAISPAVEAAVAELIISG
jgi:uncharacterized repeat protein (TIGR01451 family)